MKKILMALCCLAVAVYAQAQSEPTFSHNGMNLQQYYESTVGIRLPVPFSYIALNYTLTISPVGTVTNISKTSTSYSYDNYTESEAKADVEVIDSLTRKFLRSATTWHLKAGTQTAQTTDVQLVLRRQLISKKPVVGDRLPMFMEHEFYRTLTAGLNYIQGHLYYPTTDTTDSVYGVVEATSPSYVIRCYKGEQLVARMRYSKLSKYDVLLNGEQEMYENGRLYESIQFINGEIAGTKWYYPDGKLALQCDVTKTSYGYSARQDTMTQHYSHNNPMMCTSITIMNTDGNRVDAAEAKDHITPSQCLFTPQMAQKIKVLMNGVVAETGFTISGTLGPDGRPQKVKVEPARQSRYYIAAGQKTSEDRQNQACRMLKDKVMNGELIISPFLLYGQPLCTSFSYKINYKDGMATLEHEDVQTQIDALLDKIR